MRHLVRTTVIAAVLVSAAPLAAQQKSTPPGSADKGRETFLRIGCNSCHGTYGQGGTRDSGPKLFPSPLPFAAFSAYARAPTRDMPPYSEKMVNDQDMADIYAYISTLKPMPAAKDIPLLSQF